MRFTAKDRKLLDHFIRYYQALDWGLFEAQTNQQKHFLAVCRGEASPKSDAERAYCKYKSISYLSGPQPNVRKQDRWSFPYPAFFNRLPAQGDLCAICERDQVKRAALLFDKVHVPARILEKQWDIPYDIAICCSHWESDSVEYAMQEATEKLIDHNGLNYDDYSEGEWDDKLDEIHITKEYSELVSLFSLRYLKSHYEMTCDVTAVPILSNANDLSAFYRPGQIVAYSAALQNIPVVANDAAWQQIVEFRQDKDSKRKYRDMHLWLNQCLTCTSVDHAVDIVCQKLEDYRWAIHKHGLETAIGSVSSLIAVGSGAALTGFLNGPVYEAVSAGLFLVSGIELWVAKRLLDLKNIKRSTNREVAVIYEAGKKFK